MDEAHEPPRLELSMRLKHDPSAGMLARAAIRDLLSDYQTTDELRHDAALVVYELISNAVMQIASQEPNDQRLPWEPTKESQVKLD